MGRTPLTPERLAQMQNGFERALEFEGVARSEFLRAMAAEDADLAERVAGLLDAHARTASELENAPAVEFDTDEAADRWIGQRIDVYNITRRIGIGGMGAVYEAIRADDEFRKRVAIKLLRSQATSDTAIRRFRRERQILANLEHPHIAALYDGGVTQDGHPYFAMEFVEGEPITQWCDARSVTIGDRLELFRQVCEAVQFAHQGLVVHRDLKPANILVTSDGSVKLLDFGIATLLPGEFETDNVSPVTRVGMRAFTPDYASPEQLSGNPIGTRSDVYSLGVVLYELLCGKRPFEMQGKSPAEMERVVSESTPTRPSSALTNTHIQRLAERTPAKARSRLAGDLDAIVLKALRAEPERRYGSAAELSQDIQNFLAGRTVSARPDSFGYRFGKLVRRRRAETIAVALTLTSIIVGGLTAARQAQVANRERVRAEQEQVRATEVTKFLTTMLGAANPGSFGRDVRVREVLDSASTNANGLTATPSLEAEIRQIIGGTYLALGEHALAEAQYKLAVAARGRELPAGGRKTAMSLSQLSMTLEFQGRYAEADSLLRIADTLFLRHGFDDDEARISHLDNRGRMLNYVGSVAEAEPLFKEALALQLKQVPRNDSSLASSYANLGVVESELGKNVVAETLMLEAVAAARRAYGNVHPLVASILSPLAGVQERAGSLAQADSTYQEAIAMRRTLLGNDHPDLAWSMFNYADHLLGRQRYAESVRWSKEVLTMRGKSLKDSHPAVAASMSLLGRALDRLDSLDSAERWLRESLRIRKVNYPEGHFLIASSEGQVGAHLVLRGQYAEAEKILLKSEKDLIAARGEQAPIIADARKRLVELYEKWGKAEQANLWRAKLPKSS